jgi:hypothetical protein
LPAKAGLREPATAACLRSHGRNHKCRRLETSSPRHYRSSCCQQRQSCTSQPLQLACAAPHRRNKKGTGLEVLQHCGDSCCQQH